MPVAANNLDQLASVVGGDHLLADKAARESFSVDGVTPAAVVEPADAKELTEIVAWARSHRAALLPVTSGAYLPLGNPPAAIDVAVSLARLNRILHYDPGDLTLSVEPGTPLARVQELLAERGQFLPADPPYADRAAVGGLVAANASGPLRYAYGTWRDFIVGMKFVTGEGKRVKTGGRVVKNVAGYDLSKLMIGSLGTLALLTEINFKVFPLPSTTATFAASFPDAVSALEMRSRIVHSAWQPRAIELFDPEAGKLLTRDLPSGLPRIRLRGASAQAGPLWSLVISVGGVEKVITRYEKDFSALAHKLKAASFATLREKDEQTFWAAARNLVARAREANPATTVVKCTLPLMHVGTFLARAREVAGRYQLPTAMTAHAGSGIAYIYLLPARRLAPSLSRARPERRRGAKSRGDAEGSLGEGGPALRSPEGAGGPPSGVPDAPARMVQAATEMIHAGNNLAGRVTLPWCPTAVKRDVNVWGPLRDDFPLMQKLKAQFDPDRILNPGRFLGGI
ncbi:MAG: FAD-binding oxidoreductase [Terriglobia bacterium]